MAEKRAEGAELGRLIKQAKTQTMSFAFCPGPTDDSDVLFIHRHKNPEILAKIARDESAGTKTAFGTMEVTGKTVLLTCLRKLPAMEKQLHRYMKNQKQPMEIRVLQEQEAPPNPDEHDAAALVARLKAIQKGVAAIEEEQSIKLKSAVQGAVALIKSGDMAKSLAAVEIIENSLAAAAGTPAADPGGEATEIANRLSKFRPLVESYVGGKRSTLVRALAAAGEFFNSGDLEKAKLTVDAIENALSTADGDSDVG